MASYSLPDDLRQIIIYAEDRPRASIPKRQLARVEKQRQRFIGIHGHDGFLAETERIVGELSADSTRDLCLI